MSEPAETATQEYTYADYLTWPDDERWELIDGTAYAMTPAPSRRHQEIHWHLIEQLAPFLAGSPCQAFSAPFDVILPKSNETVATATTVVQPDLIVVCDLVKLEERGCVGAPTIIVEILSPNTSAKDLREKMRVYERAGVPEYWVISPAEKWVQIYTLNKRGRYDAPVIFGDGEQAPVRMLPGLAIDLGRVFAEARKSESG